MKRTYKKLSAFIAALGMMAAPLNAQLNGVYTINSGAGTGGTNFQTFNDLATALTTSGVAGPVTINVVANSGPYNEQVTFTQVSGASVSNRIVMNGNGNLIYFSGGFGSSHTILLNGTDYMTVNNLRVEGQGTSNAMACVLTNGADNNEFNNCEFTVPANMTSSQIIPFAISSSASSPSGGSNSGNFNSVNTCTMNNGYYGIFIYGLTGAPYNTNNKAYGNLINDFYQSGIYYPYQKNITIMRNVIQRPNRTSSTTIYGLAGWFNQGALIDGNKIHRIFDSHQTYTGSFYGMYVYYNTNPNSQNRNIVRNNIIADIKHNGTVYGMYAYYMDGDIYHNTFSFDHTTSTGGSAYGIYYPYGSTGYVNKIYNNLVSITKGGGSSKYGIYFGGVTGNVFCDNNNYYINSAGGNNYTGYYSSNANNLAALQSQGIDQSSYDLNPNFANLATGDLHPTNTALNNLGTPLGVMFDQEGAVRNPTTPDIGALEFLTPMCASTPTQTVAGPNYEICPGETVNFSIGGLSSDLGYTYQWQVSNTSAVGPFTVITGANSIMHTSSPITTNMWYSAIITCTAAGGGSIAPVIQVTVAAPTSSTVPYFENFEKIGLANRLPNCSWLAPNLGNGARTYVSSSSGNLLPRSGTSFASFSNSTPGTNYYYTNPIQMYPGITYSASVWFQTDLTGASNWTDLSIMLGTSQSPTGLVSIASTNGPAISPFYKSLSNTFTVASPGMYYVAIRATGTSGTAANLSWDDLAIDIPCSLNSPTVSLSANNTTVCAGKGVVLTASGADDYVWNTGDMTAAITVSPNMNTVYSVTGTSTLTGCGVTHTQAITVNPSPVVIVLANTQAVCAGKSVVLTAGGANSYAWSTGGNGPSISASPTGMTTYSVIGTNQYNCNTTAAITISVNPNPNVQINVSNNLICAGDPVVLTGSGAQSYQWLTSSNFVLTGNPVTSIPSTTGAYTVTGTDANGCTGTAVMSIAVEPCVGLAENTIINGVNVYPNPNNGQFRIEMSSSLNKDIRVTDVTGRVIYTAATAEQVVNVNLEGFAAGVYYVTVNTADGASQVKVIRN